MLEQNQAIARRLPEEGFGEGKFEVFDEHVAEGFVGHDPIDTDDTHGIEGLKERAKGYRTAFPDLEVKIEECFGAGDLVATRWTARGTHDGELMGISPTGRSMEIEGLSIDRFEDGQVVETWDNWDALGMMQQLGVIPAEQTA